VLTEARRKKIEEIRAAVADMLAFRDRSVSDPLHQPSEFWKLTNRYISYVRELSVEQLENIRCHVGMGFFLGSPWDKDFYSGFQTRSNLEAEKLPMIAAYLKYTKNIPAKYMASEYETNDLVSAIGVRYEGRLINSDILKAQAAIANLYNVGLLDALEGEALVAEIGPGYGQLISQLSRGCGKNCRFVLIDYPETLFWSGIFIALHADPEQIYVWNPGHEASASTLKKYRYFLIPNFFVEWIARLGTFDLVINCNSFQEMSDRQIALYAKFFSHTTKGWLYSYNANRQFMNMEIRQSVASVLCEYFLGGPDDHELEAAGFDIHNPHAKRLFVGRSKTLPAPADPQQKSRTVWIADRPFDFHLSGSRER